MDFAKVAQVTGGVLLGSCIVFADAADWAMEKAYVGVDTYYYPSEGAPGQKHGNAALVSQLEMRSSFGERWSAKLTPFMRADVIDSHRNTFDLREAEVNYVNGPWRSAVGMGSVSWSVTESVHLLPHQVVDVINQRDFAGDPAGQEKMGAAMLTLAYQGENTIVQGYLLPWFRKRNFPGVEAREQPFRGAIDLNGDVQFTSEKEEHRPGVAVRIEKSVDSANLAFIQYRGYAPDPLITPNFATGKATSLYYLVDMSAVTAQATVGKWLLKTETGYFNTRLNADRFTNVPKSYWSTVSGVEYTFARAFGESDLGLIGEWLYDSRGDAPNGSVFHNDLFLGLRWVANDQGDSEILGGVVRDLDRRANVVQLQYQRRIGTHWQTQLIFRSYNAESGHPLSAFSDDTMLFLKMHYFF
jgi:hypothetical protein